jgi:hypothetical protein
VLRRTPIEPARAAVDHVGVMRGIRLFRRAAARSSKTLHERSLE